MLEGDVDKALAGAEKVLEMEYTTDMVCHATMEPTQRDRAQSSTALGTSTAARRARLSRA